MVSNSRVTRVLCVSLPPDCSVKVKDVLREFDADGSLARHRHGEVRGRPALTPPPLAHESRSGRPALQSRVTAGY